MNPIIELRRVSKLKTVKVKEYGYVDYTEIHYQHLCKQIFIFGIPTLWWTYFFERIPSYALIQHGTLGSTDWKSKRSNLIDYHKTRQTIWRFPNEASS